MLDANSGEREVGPRASSWPEWRLRAQPIRREKV